MADLLEGYDAEGGEDYCEDVHNLIKNNWRQSDPLTNLTGKQEGMIVSDSDDDKLYHINDESIGHDEILQEHGSHDTRPRFSRLTLDVDTAAITEPPTEAELNGEYGSAALMGAGQYVFLKNTGGTERVYLIMSDGVNYWTFAGVLAT